MEGERQPPGAASAAVSKVLDDDDLLIKILLRVGFPTTLVRAALVCKRWLHHASDPAFLCHFRKLHPPHLLGFYIDDGSLPNTLCFIPMLPQPPELDVVFRRANFSLDTSQGIPKIIVDCQNGNVITKRHDLSGLILGVHNPLCARKGLTTVPLFPPVHQNSNFCNWADLLFKEEGGILSYFYVLVEMTMERTKSTVHVYMLQDGVWCTHDTLAIDQPSCPQWEIRPVLSDDKIYIAAAPKDIIVFDLTTSSFSKIQLPHGVDYGAGDTLLSRADDATGVYLIKLKELQLCIWLHKGDNWLPVDTVCLREMCSNLRMSDCTDEDEYTAPLEVCQVGDNAEFVFFRMGRCILYLDIKSRTLRKVYEVNNTCWIYYISPFKMIWPPTFPALKDDPARNTI